MLRNGLLELCLGCCFPSLYFVYSIFQEKSVFITLVCSSFNIIFQPFLSSSPIVSFKDITSKKKRNLYGLRYWLHSTAECFFRPSLLQFTSGLQFVSKLVSKRGSQWAPLSVAVAFSSSFSKQEAQELKSTFTSSGLQTWYV